eukprot:12410147-Karenia_brevis.AAC.2
MHRDIKPANIMVSRRPLVAKLTGFGSACGLAPRRRPLAAQLSGSGSSRFLVPRQPLAAKQENAQLSSFWQEPPTPGHYCTTLWY